MKTLLAFILVTALTSMTVMGQASKTESKTPKKSESAAQTLKKESAVKHHKRHHHKAIGAKTELNSK